MSGQRYAPEFIQEALRLIFEGGRSQAQVCKDLGVDDCTLRRWIKRYRIDGETKVPTLAERLENEQLKRRIHQLEEENEILKKAAAFFARDLGRHK